MMVSPIKVFSLRFLPWLFMSLALVSCTSKNERAAKAFEQASQAFGVGDYATAEKLASQAVAGHDSIPEYWSLLGRTEMSLRNYTAATSAFSRVLELQPNDAESLRILGQTSLFAGRLDDTDAFAQRLLKISQTDVVAHALQGYAAARRKNYIVASQQAALILEVDPLNDDGLALKAQVDFQQGRRDAAISSLERSLDVTGATPIKLGQLIDFYRELRDSPKLELSCLRLVDLPNSSDASAIDCGSHLAGLGSWGGALNVLTKTMRRHALFPKDRASVQLLLSKATAGRVLEDQLAGLGGVAHPDDRAMVAEVALAHGFTSQRFSLFPADSHTPLRNHFICPEESISE